MINNFTSIEYLKTGNKRQQQAYIVLNQLQVFEQLKPYNPILTGTIPIAIDTPESDLDIICQCSNHTEFTEYLSAIYGQFDGFEVYLTHFSGIESTIARFETLGFKFEVFGQDIPTTKQNAYRHMLIEHDILKKKGNEFREKIIKLKASGMKTEPAFAQLLGLEGDPYMELLQFKL